MTGQLLALLSASLFSASGVFMRKALFRAGESNTALYISIFLGTVVFSTVLAASGNGSQLATSTWKALTVLICAGFINFNLGRGLYYYGLRFIGANLASPLLNSSVVFAVILGVAFMDEPVTLGLVLGVCFILIGILLITTEKREEGRPGIAATRGDKIRGIASALSAGACYGITPVLVRAGIQEGTSPITATFISYVSASSVVLVMLLNSQRRLQMKKTPRVAIIPMVVGGFFVSMAQLCRYLALDYTPASVVQTLNSTSTLFTIPFSLAVNRSIEIFTVRVIAGALIVVMGVFFIFWLV
jgi:drug/metabolite transporter (DMT)-like permease